MELSPLALEILCEMHISRYKETDKALQRLKDVFLEIYPTYEFTEDAISDITEVIGGMRSLIIVLDHIVEKCKEVRKID